MNIYQKIFQILCVLLFLLLAYLLITPAFVPDKGPAYYLLSCATILILTGLILTAAKITDWAWNKDGWYAIGDIEIWRYGHIINRLLRTLILAGTMALLISAISLLAHRETAYLRNLGLLIGFQIITSVLSIWFRGRFPLPGKDYL